MSTCLIFALLLVFLRGLTGFQDDSGRGFIVAELIHRDSSMSPFYNSSKTANERLGEAVTRSRNRINTFNSSLYDGEKDVTSQLKPGKVDYLMKIYIGEFRDVRQGLLVMASTGSTFTWIDCSHKSDVSRYEEISYAAKECQDLPKIYHGPKLIDFDDTCVYEYSYGGKVKTEGIYSRGEFQLNSIGTKELQRFSLLFGCCINRNESTLSSSIQGMAGLGHGDLSLISQLANKLGIEKRFSYCLVPLWSDSSTHLVFGKSTILNQEYSEIPFRTRNKSPCYYLTLKSVSVQGEETQTLEYAHDNMIIDFGITVTSLDPILFNKVISFVKNSLLHLRPVEEDETNPFKLCYYLGDTRVQEKFPNIELHFLGFEGQKTSITLKYENVYVEYMNDKKQEMICMNILPAATGEVSVLGNVAQVGFHVEFNLDKKMIYFTPTDCLKYKIKTT